MMESEILRFICANQGAVNTDDLIFNLDSTNVPEIISNQEKFVSCCPSGQPKVVARTTLRLCRARSCPGTCRGLHLCKNFLFSGSCHFTRSRGGCQFSHDLNSDHNQEILGQHGLESLSRTELCTLLLQNDEGLLPPICFDYNNDPGVFGRCQKGNDCERMHICERTLNRDCSCIKIHDFTAPQPLKHLKDKGVPDDLFRMLKAVYANKEALRLFNKGKGQPRHPTAANETVRGRGRGGHWGSRGNWGSGQPCPSSTDAAVNYTDSSSNRGRGRGRGGHRGNRGGQRGSRGNRGNRGNGGNQRNIERACSTNDILADIDGLNLYTWDGQDEDNSQLKSSTSDISSAANDTDASSEDGRSRKTPEPSKTSAAVGGRAENWGNRGNQRQQKKNSSTADLTSAVRDKNENSSNYQNKRPKPIREKTQICMYFIKGHCKHEDKCFKAHDKMPYRWEVKEGDQWKALPNNETIEKDYCDPKNTYSGSSPTVHFDTMTSEVNKVRRLSTTNSLLEPTFIHTTEWLWYWEDEFGTWNLYASAAAGHRAADMDSAKLEQKFLDDDKDVVEFTAGSQSYSLSFQDMIQTNKHYGTKRLVRRRPRFVSAADVREKRVRRPLGQTTLAPVPDHWDKTQIPTTGYKRISLQHSSDEFKEIEVIFCKTMKGFDIVRMERIQNKGLWEVFQWQKTQMKNNNNGHNVTEKKLFHGTDSKYVDAICSANFDWRICGTHGTAFGKGSYFARDAKYSHSYTDDSDVKSMFVSRVLVGDFTKGSPDYRRPPSKDGGDIHFYDSCVDNVIDPSIFVVFEKHQIYPEYLLQYKTSHPLVSLYSGVPAPKPAPQPRTVSTQQFQPPPRSTASYQPSTPSHLSSTFSYQPGTPSYLSNASSYQPSTSSNQPSTSSYQPSTSSYQPSTSSYKPSTSSYKPSTPSNQPRSLSYDASTGIYQYQPRQSSTSPTSSPKEKKQSDSCVIA